MSSVFSQSCATIATRQCQNIVNTQEEILYLLGVAPHYLSLQPLATADLLSISTICLFWTVHVDGIITCAFFVFGFFQSA